MKKFWTPHRLGRLRTGLMAGLDNTALAQELRTTEAAVSCARKYYGLDLPPAGRLMLADAARELGLTAHAVRQLARRRNMALGKWGGKYITLTTAQVEELKARPIIVGKPAGYVSSTELAHRWNVDVSYVPRLLADVQPLTYRDGSRSRPAKCWPEHEAERHRPPIATGAAGLTPVELATILGHTPSAVSYWRRHCGLPAMHTKQRRNGGRWAWLHDPQATLQWLEQTGRNEAAAKLRTYLEQGNRRAA